MYKPCVDVDKVCSFENGTKVIAWFALLIAAGFGIQHLIIIIYGSPTYSVKLTLNKHTYVSHAVANARWANAIIFVIFAVLTASNLGLLLGIYSKSSSYITIWIMCIIICNIIVIIVAIFYTVLASVAYLSTKYVLFVIVLLLIVISIECCLISVAGSYRDRSLNEKANNPSKKNRFKRWFIV